MHNEIRPVVPQVVTRQLGRYRVHAIQAGGLKLDGGAMFGVVPKPLWERRIVADERNRIQMGMRCLLVEHDDGLVLIDTGVGDKDDAKFREIYGVENTGGTGETWLEGALRGLGFSPNDISLVVNTHLHFDHAGGNTRVDGAGELQLAFPRARYVVQRGELDFASRTNERTAASYFARNWEVVLGHGRLELVDGNVELRPGLAVVASPGHVPYHQSVRIDGGGGEVALFLGDVCPTALHLPLPWIMGYDVEPLVTLESKRRLLGQAAQERWLVVFAHDAHVPWGWVAREGTGFHLSEPVDRGPGE